MLREHDCPPDFILPDKATGGQLALADLIRNKRIVIAVASPNASCTDIQQLFDDASASTDSVSERDLEIVAITPPNMPLRLPQPPQNLHIVIDGSGQALRQYDSAGDTTVCYLVGKDGTIKLAQADVPALPNLLDLIDTMPMRQREAELQAAK